MRGVAVKLKKTIDKLDKKYINLYNSIKPIVNDWDPCSLIVSGAPDDEYDTLINKVISGLVNQKDLNTTRTEIIDLLENYYGFPVYSELDKDNQDKLKGEINSVIGKIRKTNANNKYT